MKRISIYVLTLMLSGLFFVACEKDDNKKLTFDLSSVEVIIGDVGTVKVSGGLTPYTATPADATVAEATVDGSDIIIKGLKAGNTTVKVTDKNGLEGVVVVVVKVDPYAEEMGDATVRFKWDTYDKKAVGENAGFFSLTKAEDKTISFSWMSADELEKFTISFKDSQDKVGGGEATGTIDADLAAKLTITKDGVSTEHSVISWRIVQVKPATDGESVPNTYWIAFMSDGKSGLFVASLLESPN